SKQWLGFSPIVEQIQLPKVTPSSSLPLEVRD
ncbi:MAG: hypothetical protein RLZZ490_2456, partial [Cyanobacteriota bacterium]